MTPLSPPLGLAQGSSAGLPLSRPGWDPWVGGSLPAPEDSGTSEGWDFGQEGAGSAPSGALEALAVPSRLLPLSCRLPGINPGPAPAKASPGIPKGSEGSPSPQVLPALHIQHLHFGPRDALAMATTPAVQHPRWAPKEQRQEPQCPHSPGASPGWSLPLESPLLLPTAPQKLRINPIIQAHKQHHKNNINLHRKALH